MPNWCNNTLAFTDENNDNDAILLSFYQDIQKYLAPENDWVGHFLKAGKIDTSDMYARGFSFMQSFAIIMF